MPTRKQSLLPYSTIKFEEKDHIAFITLARPKVANSINNQMSDELVEACQILGQRDDLQVVIVTGAGDKAFCSGRDLQELAQTLKNMVDSAILLRQPQAVQVIAGLNKPTIAAVNGHALGLGLALALACDLRLASENANFGIPDVGRGYLPLSGITQRLPRLVGKGRALEMLFTGQPIGAQEAWQIGLVNRVVPSSRLLTEAEDWARRLASKAPISLRFAKEAVNKGMDLTLDQGLRLEADLYFLLFSTHDRTEGIRAFQEKRTPQFTRQ